MSKISLLFSACLCSCLSAFGQACLSPYTVHTLRGLTSRSVIASSSEASHPSLRAYIHLNAEADRASIESLGVKITQDLGTIITATVPIEAIEKLKRVDGVSYISASLSIKPMLSDARAATGVDLVHKGDEVVGAYRGNGVVVGIIDAGFDYSHPAFRNSDRTELRIKRVWEQATEQFVVPGSARPEGYEYGMEFDTPEEILTACADREGNSHGTHVAAIAAGGDTSADNPFYGVAPEADIVLVSYGALSEGSTNISDAISYIYRYARSVGKPCVINMSLGQQMGPHDGTSSFDVCADLLQDKGCLLVGSVGNFGASPLHVTNADGGSVTTAINFLTAPTAYNSGGDIDIWGEAGKSYAIRLSIVNKMTGETICSSEDFTFNEQPHTFTFTPDSPTRGTIVVTTEINPLNGKPHALVSSGITSLRSTSVVAITVTPTEQPATVHMWADGSLVLLTDAGIRGFANGDTDMTLAEIGGTGRRITSVGAFVTSHGQGQLYPADVVGDIASFSSRGLTADGRMKPDVTAPGSYIASALSSYATAAQGTVAKGEEWNGRFYQYGYMEGTSMAAPFVTGVVALWLQAYPEMSPEELREVIAASSTRDDFTSVAQSSTGIWGYGKVAALEGLKKALSLKSAAGIEDKMGESASDILTVNEGELRMTSASDVLKLTLTLFDLSGRTLHRVSFENVKAGETFTLSTSGIPHGVYLVTVKNGRQTRSYRQVL